MSDPNNHSVAFQATILAPVSAGAAVPYFTEIIDLVHGAGGALRTA